MKLDESKIGEVLEPSVRYVVPLYQRQYQWHDQYDGGRISAFWLDVVAKATDVLDDDPGKRVFEHYMGALLLDPDYSSATYGKTKALQVVDGQQRLTTFLILLCAMREVAREHEMSELADRINKYLINEKRHADTDELARYKLTPTPVDRDVFFSLLENDYAEVREVNAGSYYRGTVPKGTDARSLRAYEYFKAQIHEFLESGLTDDSEVGVHVDEDVEATDCVYSEEGERRLEALLRALVDCFKVVVISLGKDDDAQVIYETLNSKGQPLRAMDLVRNSIFYRAEQQYADKRDAKQFVESLYNDVWKSYDQPWWQADAPNARPARARIDHFLANVLTTETASRVTVRELYAAYISWAIPEREPLFDKVEEELSVLQQYTPAYEALEGRYKSDDENPIAWIGERLRLWQNTTVYPVLLKIASEDVEDATLWNVAKILDSYFARRILCDLTPKNYNKVFPNLVQALQEKGVSTSTVVGFFGGADADTTKFPSDKELKRNILETHAYDRIPSRILSDILWSIELKCRSDLAEQSPRPPEISVEHIMPKYWEKHWMLNGEFVEVNSHHIPGYLEREEVIHTLGNLTIVTGKLNSSMKNESFDEKRDKLNEHSNLVLNRRILEFETWDEDSIRERGEELAASATQIWPSLESFSTDM